jgi:hypothetical protein
MTAPRLTRSTRTAFAFPSRSACDAARVRRRAGAATALALACVAVAPRARAENAEAKACAQAYVEGQRLRQADQVVEASQQFLICARSVCPEVLRKDCVPWSASADKAVPTIVIEATDAQGQDLVDVHVTVDGRPFLDRIDGRAAPIDPGVHTLRYTTPGAAPIEQRVVIHEAEKDRHLRVTFATAAATPSASVPASSSAPAASGPPGGESRPTPTLVYVLGGVGVVALGGFTYMAIKFDGKVSDLDKCKPNCSESSVNSASETRTLSFIPLGIGVVSLGAAAYLYFSRPTRTTNEQARRPAFDVVSIPGGALTTLSGTF